MQMEGCEAVQVNPASTWQFAEQPSPPTLFLSSHPYPALRRPFPQSCEIYLWHVELQPSPLIRFPSSQASPASTKPLPQRFTTQSPPTIVAAGLVQVVHTPAAAQLEHPVGQGTQATPAALR